MLRDEKKSKVEVEQQPDIDSGKELLKDILPWVVPPPCNSCKGFTFRFNRGLLLTSFWDCYRLGAVPKFYLPTIPIHLSPNVGRYTNSISESSLMDEKNMPRCHNDIFTWLPTEKPMTDPWDWYIYLHLP